MIGTKASGSSRSEIVPTSTKIHTGSIELLENIDPVVFLVRSGRALGPPKLYEEIILKGGR